MELGASGFGGRFGFGLNWMDRRPVLGEGEGEGGCLRGEHYE